MLSLGHRAFPDPGEQAFGEFAQATGLAAFEATPGHSGQRNLQRRRFPTEGAIALRLLALASSATRLGQGCKRADQL